jgi:uncharacterized protein (UPF0548 family)
MLLANRPSCDRTERFLEEQRTQPFSYRRVGATRTGAQPEFTVDHNRVQLGGVAVFGRAKDALRRWTMFDLGWLDVHRPGPPIEEGRTVAVVASHFGFWSMNACRIVYIIDDAQRFGFAYGTLPSHAEIGEERFMVELRDGAVWYDILAFSRPRGLARFAYPLTRALQRRFARDSMRAMRAAI